jgi:hypothetical protein
MSDRPLVSADCPDVAELLLASEGELSKRRLESVREHVRRCARCRERLGDTSSLIGAYGDVVMDAPPTPTEIDEADARYERFRTRLREEAAPPRPVAVATSSWPPIKLKMTGRAWLPVAAVVPVIVIALLFSRSYTSTLKADELLTRAVVREQAVPKATVQRVQIHFTPAAHARPDGRRVATGGTITRDVGAAALIAAQAEAQPRGHAQPLPAPTQSPEFAEETLATLFTANQLDLGDPLSVSRFQAWRSSLTQKTDIVRSEQHDTLLALKTMTDEGTLRSAEIVVRQSDYHPVRQNLTFQDIGEVEIVEVATWVVATPPSVEPAPPAPVASARPAPASIDRAALDDAEIEARSVLHRAAADLDPRVSVARTNRTVEVRGVVQRAEHARLEGRLNAIGHVVTNLKPGIVGATVPIDPPPVTSSSGGVPLATEPVAKPAETKPSEESVPTPSTIEPSATVPAAPVLGRWRERTFGRGASSEAFGPELVRAVDRLCARGDALQALAVRYPEREQQRLSSESAEKLQALVADHYRDFANELDALDGQLALFLGTSTRPTLDAAAAGDWRRRAAVLAVETAKLGAAVRGLLQLDDVPLPDEIEKGRGEPAALSKVRRSLDALWAAFQ